MINLKSIQEKIRVLLFLIFNVRMHSGLKSYDLFITKLEKIVRLNEEIATNLLEIIDL